VAEAEGEINDAPRGCPQSIRLPVWLCPARFRLTLVPILCAFSNTEARTVCARRVREALNVGSDSWNAGVFIGKRVAPSRLGEASDEAIPSVVLDVNVGPQVSLGSYRSEVGRSRGAQFKQGPCRRPQEQAPADRGPAESFEAVPRA
jgi:hypothetical protein